MASQAGAGVAPGAAESMSWGRVERGMPEGAQQFWSRIGVGEDPEGVQRPQGGTEGSGGRGRCGSDAHVGVVGQGQVGRERVGQIAGGRRVAHHVGIKRRVGRVRPGHGQALPLVLHPAVLEPNLRGEGRREPSRPAAPLRPAAGTGPCPGSGAGGSGSAGEGRPAPALAPRGSCHRVRRDRLSPYKSTGRPSGAALLGCLFSFLLARACPADTPPQPRASPAALPPCSRFAAQNYLGLLLPFLFSCANVFEKAKQSEINTRSATGFLFPPPRAERGLDWTEGRIKNNLLGRGWISGAGWDGSGSRIPAPALLLAAGCE